MAFSQAGISDVRHSPLGGELFVSWKYDGTAGAVPTRIFQVYVNRTLAWFGYTRSVNVILPTLSGPIEIGTVAAGEGDTDYSSSLPSLPPDRAELSWIGGSFEGEDLAGFHVYQGAAAGEAVNFSALPVADINAYTQGIILDGAGMGGAGWGGAGQAGSFYLWKSDPLTNGTWNFAVVPYDFAGNEGEIRTVTFTIDGPPEPPALDATGRRMHLSYSATTGRATLTWNPSPSA